MAAAAPLISDPIVRNLGTIGGSLCHADPAGDWGSVMLALQGSGVIDNRYRRQSSDEQHERMSKELGISVEALRSRAHHIRKTLKDCVRERGKGEKGKRKAFFARL